MALERQVFRFDPAFGSVFTDLLCRLTLPLLATEGTS